MRSGRIPRGIAAHGKQVPLSSLGLESETAGFATLVVGRAEQSSNPTMSLFFLSILCFFLSQITRRYSRFPNALLFFCLFVFY